MDHCGEKTPNAHRQETLRRSELPLFCPRPGTSLWNSHPRVYLDVEKTGVAVCPYCGTCYRLID